VIEYCAKSEFHRVAGRDAGKAVSVSFLTSHVSQAGRVPKYITVGGARSGLPARAMGVVAISGIKA
jgi:hypothetical protein